LKTNNNNNNNITIYKAHNVRKKLNLRRRKKERKEERKKGRKEEKKKERKKERKVLKITTSNVVSEMRRVPVFLGHTVYIGHTACSL